MVFIFFSTRHSDFWSLNSTEIVLFQVIDGPVAKSIEYIFFPLFLTLLTKHTVFEILSLHVRTLCFTFSLALCRFLFLYFFSISGCPRFYPQPWFLALIYFITQDFTCHHNLLAQISFQAVILLNSRSLYDLEEFLPVSQRKFFTWICEIFVQTHGL